MSKSALISSPCLSATARIAALPPAQQAPWRAYLAPLGKSVQAAEVKGKTVYRLRVNAGSANQASDLCGKLKLAGENCFIAR